MPTVIKIFNWLNPIILLSPSRSSPLHYLYSHSLSSSCNDCIFFMIEMFVISFKLPPNLVLSLWNSTKLDRILPLRKEITNYSNHTHKKYVDKKIMTQLHPSYRLSTIWYGPAVYWKVGTSSSIPGGKSASKASCEYVSLGEMIGKTKQLPNQYQP